MEVNQQVIIATRMLGQGLIGLNVFCGLMNIGIAMKQQIYTNMLKRISGADTIYIQHLNEHQNPIPRQLH